MTELEVYNSMFEFNRARTLALLNKIEEDPNCGDILAWRPGKGRAHLAWQFMHLAATDDRYLQVKILGNTPQWPDLCDRYAGGSTPDDNIPSIEEVKETLERARQPLLDLLGSLDPSKLDEMPLPDAQRTYRQSLEILSWHEGHHQGQAHITLNLYRAAH
ncbi:MAG: DinB family protein [Planctomycetota bacterium]|nr:DinB family protein [Planctomycetota bacterium]MDA1141981.1 DinB family protein [Planctomycetota bacterium]